MAFLLYCSQLWWCLVSNRSQYDESAGVILMSEFKLAIQKFQSMQTPQIPATRGKRRGVDHHGQIRPCHCHVPSPGPASCPWKSRSLKQLSSWRRLNSLTKWYRWKGFQMFPDVSRCFQMFPDVSRCFQMFQMFPDVSRCFQMFPDVSRCFPDVSRCFQMFPDVSRCFQMFPDVSRCFQMFPDVSRCFQMFPDVSRCFQMFPDVSRCFQMFPDVSRCFQMFPGFTGVAAAWLCTLWPCYCTKRIQMVAFWCSCHRWLWLPFLPSQMMHGVLLAGMLHPRHSLCRSAWNRVQAHKVVSSHTVPDRHHITLGLNMREGTPKNPRRSRRFVSLQLYISAAPWNFHMLVLIAASIFEAVLRPGDPRSQADEECEEPAPAAGSTCRSQKDKLSSNGPDSRCACNVWTKRSSYFLVASRCICHVAPFCNCSPKQISWFQSWVPETERGGPRTRGQFCTCLCNVITL